MFKVQTAFKEAADLIHQYGGLVVVHNGSKANGLDDQVRHEGPGPRNVSLADSLGPLKEELMHDYIDICEVTNETDDVEFYLKQFNKPSIVASDAHTTDAVGTKFVWIKANPTFDGLKQILFEPEERVRIREEQPEKKSAYQIIESITVSQPEFWEQTIPINPNLVTIIGGRSSGKTTLLNCLAEQIGYFQQYNDNEFSYEERNFVDDHKASLTVKWADNSTPQDRHVDFFRQNFMINFQEKRDEITKLINRILKDTDKAPLLEQREQFIQSTRNSIMNACNSLFIQRNQLEELDAKIKEKGGVEGHAKVVEGLQNQLAEQKKEHSGLTDEEQSQFEKLKQEIEGCEIRLVSLKRDKDALAVLILNAQASQEAPIDVSSFSGELGTLLLEKHTAIWENAKAEWIGALQAMANEINEDINKLNNRLIQLKQPEIYQKGMVDLEANSALKDLEEKIKLEKAKYADVEALAKKRKRLQEDNQSLIAEIADRHAQYQIEAQNHAANIAQTIENLSIKGVISVKTELLRNKLEGQLTRKSKEQQKFVESIIQHDTFGKKQTAQFLRKIMNREIACNQDVNEEYLVSELMSTNWFDVNYDIIYQGDTFIEMSPGKRAFVILRLLLEFSKNECPILIDQPEDSLDNRAIFNELVQYLRAKKKQRQIILVTHNPNVVVGADAEQVIVANQRGSKNENMNDFRFAYVSGALENTRPRDPACPTILESQGIREHVCEILEGGKEAFKKRENKYGFAT